MNTITGIRQGEAQARKEQSAKRKAAKLAKRSSTRSAGRAAAARGGIGIVCKTLKNRKSVRKTLDYIFQKDKNPQIVSTNCGNQHDAMKSMNLTSKLRPRIQNTVGHMVVSLPIQVGRGEDRWEQIIDHLRAEVGVTDDFPFVAVRHSDGDANHCHIVYSRISILGDCHNGDNLGYRLATAAQKIETEFKLKLFPRAEQKVMVSKNEIEMGLRTQTLLPRLQIAAALEVAIQGKPTAAQFVERLNAAGVGVKANVSPTTGKMSGFSFSYDGIAFSGSKIGKEYGWQQLEKAINYDQNRDTEYLAGLDGTTGSASRDLANAIATINGLDLAVARVDPTTPDIAAAAGRGAPAADRASELLNKNSAERNQRAEATTDRADRADRDADPVLYRTSDHLSEFVEPADLSHHQTSLTTTGDLQKPGELANRPDRPDRVLQRSAGTSAGREKIARPAASIRDSNKLPSGFVSQRPLDLSQQGWVASLPNRIRAARSTGQRVLLVGLLDARDRVAAIKTNLGYSITDLKIVTDEQLTVLLLDAGDVAQPIKIEGNSDFCQRVAALAKTHGLVVAHDHQISEAERRAAQRRWEERQREEQRQRLETPAPRPS